MGTTDDCTTVHPPTARTKTNKYPRVPGCPILFAFSAKGWEPQTIALRLHPQLPKQKRINIRELFDLVGHKPGCPILFAFSAKGWEPQTIALRFLPNCQNKNE